MGMRGSLRWGAAVFTGCLLGSSSATAEPLNVVEELVALRARYGQPSARARLPLRLVASVTAWQESPVSLVFSGDPTPGTPDRFPMTHPLFAFAWADGRHLVVDAGLARADAQDFGNPLEWLGADPMRCDPEAWSALRAPRARVAGALFTHLHVDHVTGIRELCRERDAVPILLSPEQETSDERYERDGREKVEALIADGCAQRAPWKVTGRSGAVQGFPDLPGVLRVAVPGHTPGSQLLVGFVAGADRMRSVVIAGDVVNHRAAYASDLPKPWWYRWLVVREDEAAQKRNRSLLRDLEAAGFEILVNHDVAERNTALPDAPCS